MAAAHYCSHSLYCCSSKENKGGDKDTRKHEAQNTGCRQKFIFPASEVKAAENKFDRTPYSLFLGSSNTTNQGTPLAKHADCAV